MSLLSLNQTEKIDHELQASACRIESLSEQWLTFQMNEFSPYLGMTPDPNDFKSVTAMLQFFLRYEYPFPADNVGTCPKCIGSPG
ncbi:hypothetical protein [Pseudomonas aeruginosa]|uniref:hypothetical protein n=1 Tax=Pseudomonas aeruginosa TaxID=287 RepID=UPI00149562FE|nr:hypothetical protein [Pseudomonas aeruginosa]